MAAQKTIKKYQEALTKAPQQEIKTHQSFKEYATTDKKSSSRTLAKGKTLLTKAQDTMKSAKEQLISAQADYREWQTMLKKFQALEKAVVQFEKNWDKKTALSLKKKVKKRRDTRKASQPINKNLLVEILSRDIYSSSHHEPTFT